MLHLQTNCYLETLFGESWVAFNTWREVSVSIHLKGTAQIAWDPLEACSMNIFSWALHSKHFTRDYPQL